MRLILYSKPGCHLCEGLGEKLMQVQGVAVDLEIRDITTRDDWFQAYQYEIPVLIWQRDRPDAPPDLIPLPRMSPRASVAQVEALLSKMLTGQ
ncbi:MAG: glutaredoxin family protein [Cyanobacteria bacterium J069]|nr:MAG: glutaredoxin family protein [Cyanobacteria bacterium J069]